MSNISSHKLYTFTVEYFYENICNEKQETLPLISTTGMGMGIQHVDNNLLFKQPKLWLSKQSFRNRKSHNRKYCQYFIHFQVLCLSAEQHIFK